MRHLKKAIFPLVLGFCLVGCVNAQKAAVPAKETTDEPPAIIGTWTGVRPDGLRVVYRFNSDRSMVWTIGDRPPIRAVYQYNGKVSPAAVDIFGFQVGQLQGFRYIAIAEVMGDSMRFAGVPTRNGLTIRGEAAVRPNDFPEDALWLERSTR